MHYTAAASCFVLLYQLEVNCPARLRSLWRQLAVLSQSLAKHHLVAPNLQLGVCQHTASSL
jgi:hypothetical protein